MDVISFRDYCMSLPMTEECTPFDQTTLVMKVGGKMYAYADMVNFNWVALKCDPDEAIALREEHLGLIVPAYHSNKRHWNGVDTTGELPDSLIRSQIRNSYLLVLSGVTPRALRNEIQSIVDEQSLRAVTSDK